MKHSIAFLAIFLIFQLGAQAQKKALVSAMEDELARSMEHLKLEGEGGPYYLSYLLHDAYSLRITADSGAITVNSENRNRTLKVDLRVGSYAQDNSNFLSLTSLAGLTGSATPASIRMPIDDDYYVLRRQIWKATDRAYKDGLETLTKKKAMLQNVVRAEILPDFVRGGAISSLAPENSLNVRREQWNQLVDQLAKHFVPRPNIQRSKVDLNVQIANSYYVNSEGARVIEPFSAARLTITAMTQAEDGMPLHNFRMYTAARPESLPDKAVIGGDIKILISELSGAGAASPGEEYSGPVLFLGQAAGEFFSQGFGNLLAAKKIPLSDSPQANAMLSRYLENPFLSKINMKVAANFLSLRAIPTLKSHNQKALLGTCTFDEEGVPCSDVSLIENGMLKGLLSSRVPVRGIAQSNGHARGGAAAPSVIHVTSANKKSYQQLKQELLNAAKEEGLGFGYVVRGLTPASESMSGDADVVESLLLSQQSPPEPTQFRLTKPYSIFRVYMDGREEPVRGLEFGSVSINALKNVIATSDDEIVYDYPATATGATSGMSGLISLLGPSGVPGRQYYATVIVPSLLIGGIDLKKSAANYPKVPIVDYPVR